MAFRYRDYKHGMKKHNNMMKGMDNDIQCVLLWATWAPNISYNKPNSIPSVKTLNIEWLGPEFLIHLSFKGWDLSDFGDGNEFRLCGLLCDLMLNIKIYQS